MLSLSSSDVSAFLHVTRLFRIVAPTKMKKYMNLSRDLPEYSDLIDIVNVREDKVILAGQDLRVLTDWYMNPMTHWTIAHKIRVQPLLVMVVSIKG